MAVTIKVKRASTEAQILESQLQIGEMAFCTSTATLWGYNGIYKNIIGRAIVDYLSNLPTYSGSPGRFFYALDTQALYIHDGSDWATVSGGGEASVTISGVNGITTYYDTGVWYVDGTSINKVSGISRKRGTGIFVDGGFQITHNIGTDDHHTDVALAGNGPFDAELIASVGDIYVQIGQNTDIVYNTGGPPAYGITFYWESTYDADISLTSYGDEVRRGIGTFSVSGTQIIHGLSVDHFTSIIPSSNAPYSDYQTASVGNIYVQIGELEDTVYNTGGPPSEGIPFYWEVTSSGSMVGDYVSFEQLVTMSGSIIAYVDQQISDITNLIPSVTASGNLMGTGVFNYETGYTIIHNLNTASHYVCVTPADTTVFDEYLIASIGNIYVRKGLNQDIVYHTGGTWANGIIFDWEIIKHGLKMIEET